MIATAKEPKVYPLGDTPSEKETGGASFNERVALSWTDGSKGFRAVATGEKRRPRRGEWFLSGAIIAAYKASNDLSTSYHIAKLVRVVPVPATVKIVPMVPQSEKRHV